MQVTPQSNKKGPQAMAAANKSREMQEKERRRATIALPTSLAAPSIVSNLTSDEKKDGS